MNGVTFFVDTGILIALSGLKGIDLLLFKNRIERHSIKLLTSHIQIDEQQNREITPYSQKIQKALTVLSQKGIEVRVVPTKIIVFDVSRFGFAQFSSAIGERLYDDLRRTIDLCEKVKGHAKSSLNIARDAAIAVSAIGFDYFITCDKCLYESCQKLFQNECDGQQVETLFPPKTLYVKHHPPPSCGSDQKSLGCLSVLF